MVKIGLSKCYNKLYLNQMRTLQIEARNTCNKDNKYKVRKIKGNISIIKINRNKNKSINQ